jgi:predicted DNA-binding transcriptional regulator YafY
MTRSSNPERAKRINAAVSLIKKEKTSARAADALAEEFGISRRQAYRYVSEAQTIGKEISIPDIKIAFTVKLSKNLIKKLRKYTKTTGQSLSEIVTQALEAFLQNGRRRG